MNWKLLEAPENIKTGADVNVKLLIADLFRAIETDTESVANLDEARGVLEMLLAVYAAQLKGGRVMFPLKERIRWARSDNESRRGCHLRDLEPVRWRDAMTRNTRREFLIATAGVGVWSVSGFGQGRSPNERLNIGFIGVVGCGGQNIAEMASDNVAALCDVDERHLGIPADLAEWTRCIG